MAASSTNVLIARGIRKSFGPNEVLKGVDFDLRSGEVHALLGENGAGKTTLLKILCGRYQPTAGDIEIEGRSFSHLTPALAQNSGVEIVPQLVELVDDLSIADNIFLGRWPRRGLRIDYHQMVTRSAAALSELGITLDPRITVRDLSYVERQMVEIARISQFQPRVIILDEPTAALSVREIRILFSIVDQLRARGIGFIFVTHFLSEVTRMSDRVTILRDGVVAASGPTNEFTIEAMIRHMVGDVRNLYAHYERSPGNILFSLKDVVTDSISDFSLDLREGEIVGIAAPKGEGVSELLRAVCRISGQLKRGRREIRGHEVRIRSPAQAFERGIGYLSEDRKKWGLIHGRSIRENLTVSTLKKFSSQTGVLSRVRERATAAQLIQRFSVNARGLEADIGTLSGGNQQKVLLARLFNAGLDVYIIDDPTFGVDVASKAQIHRLIANEAARGAGFILHSSDLDELVEMSDRILLVKNGAVFQELRRGSVTVAQLEELLEA